MAARRSAKAQLDSRRTPIILKSNWIAIRLTLPIRRLHCRGEGDGIGIKGKEVKAEGTQTGIMDSR